MQTILNIKQCNCTACGHKWVTSSAYFASQQYPLPHLSKSQENPICIVWEMEIDHPRCFRCITIEEYQNRNLPLSNTFNQQLNLEPSPIDFSELDKLGE